MSKTKEQIRKAAKIHTPTGLCGFGSASAAAAAAVLPVEIGGGIGHGGRDLEEIGADGVGETTGQGGGDAAGTEIGD